MKKVLSKKTIIKKSVKGIDTKVVVSRGKISEMLNKMKPIKKDTSVLKSPAVKKGLERLRKDLKKVVEFQITLRRLKFLSAIEKGFNTTKSVMKKTKFTESGLRAVLLDSKRAGMVEVKHATKMVKGKSGKRYPQNTSRYSLTAKGKKLLKDIFSIVA